MYIVPQNFSEEAFGYIAQWLERLTADQQVPGSNPGVPSYYLLLSFYCVRQLKKWPGRFREVRQTSSAQLLLSFLPTLKCISEKVFVIGCLV